MRILIVGGVATGMSAATRLRRLDEHAEITVYEKSGNVSYANCGLPYYLSGVIDSRAALLLQTPKSLKDRFNLDVQVNSEVLSIDLANKTIRVRNTEAGVEHTDSYDKLIIATGARPRLFDVPGGERAIPLRNIEDVDRIKANMDDFSEKTAVIVGSGFIGIEVAENLHEANYKIHLVNSSKQVMGTFDSEIAEPLQKAIDNAGITMHLGLTVKEVTPTSVVLTDGQVLPAALVINAAGISPEVTLAKEAGLTIGETGGIWVDENHRTSDADVYAGGDAAQKQSFLSDNYGLIPLANLANRHGRAIADAIYGLPTGSTKSLGTSIIGAFGIALAMTGLSEKTAKQQNIEYKVIHLHPSDHAGYYPGASAMSMKVLFDPATGLILGAQAVGAAGVDKRIDVIATAIKGGLTINDLMDLELTYAPQFGSAKDAINQAGYLGNNVFTGKTKTIQWDQVDEFVAAGFTLIDVRTPSEHDAGNIPGSKNIEVNVMREHLEELKDKKVVVFCQVGQRGHTATQLLQGYGIEVVNLDGGYKTWRTAMDARERKEGK
jgi:NADPH-dependent 2,4-dienoyl-CoA reductase/sulfur reductase-like enzyme/rhodanese-related sulfurtransferase